jgi:CarD family transcriptional regulator
MTRPVRSGSTALAPAARTAGASPSGAKSGAKGASRPSDRGRRPAGPVPSVPSSPPPPPVATHRPSARPYGPGALPIPSSPPVPAPEFKVGDKAVHPAHGVGEVTAIEQREIGGTRATFYILRILDNGMKVMVPRSAATQVGLRGIMSEKEANGILSTMRAREVAVDVQPWSRRFRVYTEMIKSGSAIEIAKVLRDMNRLKFDKELSFGERRLLDQARGLLLKELAFAKKRTEAEMAAEIQRIFSA